MTNNFIEGVEIAVDFDGTCVTHDYPDIGKDIGAAKVLRQLANDGAKLILWTMRSGAHLDDAVNWFKKNGIPLYGVQRNPTQDTWTDSPKAYAKVYIDDAALGCPLKYDLKLSRRPCVDWDAVRLWFYGAKG